MEGWTFFLFFAEEIDERIKVEYAKYERGSRDLLDIG